jgi:heme-degrading monooxygenase HmoA
LVALQIVRIWKGYGKEAGVNRYCREHFPNSVLPQLRSINGFVGAKVLTRAGEGETEVVVATTWDSIDSVKAFAGEDYEQAIVDPVVHDLLTRFDDRVTHFTVALDA